MQIQVDKDFVEKLILAIFASSGFWALLVAMFNKFVEKKSAKNRMIKGLGHDRIIFLCEKYLEQGWISPDDFENLHDYLYVPYKKMGGNGTAEKMMADVMRLPSTPPKPKVASTKSASRSRTKTTNTAVSA